MVLRMKTTLVIPDPVFKSLKRRAAERGETISGLATELLRKGLAQRPSPKRLPPLPVFRTGPAKVNIADREALERAMEEG